MFDFISKLQEKPEAHRRRIALGTTSIITFFIAVVWLSSFSGASSPPSAQEAAVAGAPSPFETVGSIFGKAYKGAKNSVPIPGINDLSGE